MGRAARELEFTGVFAAGVTSPRKGTQEVDFVAALDLIDFVGDSGVKGIALLSATGEFVHYSLGDRQRLVYLGNKRTRIPLLAGVSHSTFAGAVELGVESIAAGADALLVMPPYFYPYRQAEVETFFVEFAQEVGSAIPIFIDHAPAFSSAIETETLQRLLDTGLFTGIIDSSGDWPYFERLLELRRQHPFVLVCGNDGLALSAIASGADALLSPSACAVPELVVAIDRSARRGNFEKAKQLNAYLEEFLQRVVMFPFPVGLKKAVELRGQSAGVPAVPLSPAARVAMDEFSAWFKPWFKALQPGVKEASRA